MGNSDSKKPEPANEVEVPVPRIARLTSEPRRHVYSLAATSSVQSDLRVGNVRYTQDNYPSHLARGLDNRNPVRSVKSLDVAQAERTSLNYRTPLEVNNFPPELRFSETRKKLSNTNEGQNQKNGMECYSGFSDISNQRNTYSNAISPASKDTIHTLPQTRLETKIVKPPSQPVNSGIMPVSMHEKIYTKSTIPTVSQGSCSLQHSTKPAPVETKLETKINKPLNLSQNSNNTPIRPFEISKISTCLVNQDSTPNYAQETIVVNKPPINSSNSDQMPLTPLRNIPNALISPARVAQASVIVTSKDTKRNSGPLSKQQIKDLVNILALPQVPQDNDKVNHVEKLDSLSKQPVENEDESYSGSEEMSLSSFSESDDETFPIIENSLASFTNLTPKASTENKEVITISKDGNIKEKEAHIRRMINTIFLLEYFIDYFMRKKDQTLCLKDIVGFEKDCPKPFVRVIQFYPGHNFEDKLEEFILAFNFVFDSDNIAKGPIRISSTSREFINNSYKSLIKDIIVYLIGEDRNELLNILEFIQELFKSEPFPRYATYTLTQLRDFAKGYTSEFHVDKCDLIHVVEVLEIPSSQPKENRSLRAKVISFFEEEMKLAGGLYIKDLSKLLSWKKSELLANLSDRSPESIFQILESSNSFESKDNKIYFRSVTSKLPKSPANLTPKPASTLSAIIIPSKPSNTSSKSEDVSTSCCIVGTIFSIGKISGTIFCAPGSNSKTMFVLIPIGTTINGKLQLDFSTCLKIGDKVVFSASSSILDGLIKWTASNILTSSMLGKNYNCLDCQKKVNMNQANSQTNVTNGIASDDRKTFFWNVHGKVASIGMIHMTIACYLSRKSNRQRMNVFCDQATILLDSEGNQLKCFADFAFEEVVNCDVLLVSVNNELLWVATEVRKSPVNYEKIYQNEKIAYNCEGLVSSHQGGIGRVMVIKSQTNKSIGGKNAEYRQKKVWFIRSQFPIQNFDSRLKLTEKIIFDAILGPDGKWNVYIIRKSLRPFPPYNGVEIEPKNNPITISEPNFNKEEFYLSEMSEVTKALVKPYNLTSVFADTLETWVTSENKKNGITQTMSTGPIVSVTSIGSNNF